MALIIFDIDGTLLQTDLVTVPAVQRTLAAYGLPPADPAMIVSFFGRPVEQYLDWLAEQCPRDKAQEIVEATNRLELELVGKEGKLYPAVREALDTLRARGHTLAICSNGPEDYVEEFLRTHRMAGFFTAVRTRGNRYPGKKEMIREVMDAVPARPVIVVGDREDDISAAHQNGASAIAACYGFGNEKEWREADARVENAQEITTKVDTLLP